MKTLRFWFGLAVLLTLFASARPGRAQGTARASVELEMQRTEAAQEAQDGLGPKLERLARKLDLTGAQKQDWQAAFARHKAGLKEEAQAVRAAGQAFRAALENPDSAPDTLKDLNRALADLRFALIMETRALCRELRTGLSPEQDRRAGPLERQLMEKGEPGPGGWTQGDPDRLTVFAD
jgi:DNA repair exonuclease SbcCD ATPase subunit